LPPVPRTLPEDESKALLAGYGVPFAPEVVAKDVEAAVAAADQLGYPVVAKLNGEGIAHKTERGLVRLGLADAPAVSAAAADLFAAARPEDGEVSVLVAPFLKANRELIAGIHRDPQFGPTVMLGLGGILAEAVADVAFRLAPFERVDAADLLDQLRTQAILGPFRGEPEVDRTAVEDVLLALSLVASEREDVLAVDVNPILLVDGKPVAVDALVEVESA
jgi:acetate---CoA ligase (ADP-forming) subunit beta